MCDNELNVVLGVRMGWWLGCRYEQKTLSQRAQWEELAPLLPPDTKRGPPCHVREVVNGSTLWSLWRPWRLMPHPATVGHGFRNWRDDAAVDPAGEDHGKRGPRGYDAGKRVTGRKRHIVVDLLLAVVVHAANIQDRDGAKLVLAKLGPVSQRRLQVNAGYVVSWAWDSRRGVVVVQASPAIWCTPKAGSATAKRPASHALTALRAL